MMIGSDAGKSAEKPPENADVTPVEQPANDRLIGVVKRVEVLEKKAEQMDASEFVQLPLFQHAVNAGPPGEITEEIEEYITIPKKWIKHPAATFAVRASGDSMIGADIQEGDVLITDREASVKDKCIVIASLNGSQTVKRILIQRGAVILAPENHTYEAIMIKDTDTVDIIGVVIAIWRTLY
jgi:DNA polymerase V